MRWRQAGQAERGRHGGEPARLGALREPSASGGPPAGVRPRPRSACPCLRQPRYSASRARRCALALPVEEPSGERDGRECRRGPRVALAALAGAASQYENVPANQFSVFARKRVESLSRLYFPRASLRARRSQHGIGNKWVAVIMQLCIQSPGLTIELRYCQSR